jgi:hypothetical protein
MLHNKRREPPDLPKPIPKWYPPFRDDIPLAKRRQRDRQRFPWRYDMTLCLTALSIGSRTPPRDLQFALVTVTDERIETDITGGNFGEKKKNISHDGGWKALWADSEAEADDFANTLKEVLQPETFTPTNIVQKLSEAAAIHKKKLTERYVSLRLGMSFENFRTNGEREVPGDVRNRLWYNIEHLDFGCEMIAFGFLNGMPVAFKIDRDGNVSRVHHFAAIGSGAKIAESVLYQREQQITIELNHTLYNVYEAFKMASQAPAVAGGPLMWIFEREITDRSRIVEQFVTQSGIKVLEKCFKKYAPKKATKVPVLKDDDLFTLPTELIRRFTS